MLRPFPHAVVLLLRTAMPIDLPGIGAVLQMTQLPYGSEDAVCEAWTSRHRDLSLTDNTLVVPRIMELKERQAAIAETVGVPGSPMTSEAVETHAYQG
jgi:hypothetical protein